MGPLRGSTDVNFLDESLNARNAFTPEKADEQLRQYGFSLSGTITPEQDVVLDERRRRLPVHVAEPAAPCCPTAPPSPTRCCSSRATASTSAAALDHADHEGPRRCALSVDVDTSKTQQPRRRRLQPVQPRVHERVDQHDGPPVGERADRPADVHRVAAPAALHRQRERVGGRGADHPRERRLHRRRRAAARRPAGVRLRVRLRPRLRARRPLVADRARSSRAGRSPSDDITNYLGTFTFASLADYEPAGRRRTRRRIGDPNLTLLDAAGGGLRAGRLADRAQPAPHRRACATACRATSSDRWNLSPRATFAWSPLRSGNLTHPRQLRLLLRLDRRRPLQADAARRRRPPARNQHRQSVLPDSRRRAA